METIKWDGDDVIVRELWPSHTLEISYDDKGLKIVVYWEDKRDGKVRIVGRKVIDLCSLTGVLK